MANGKQLACSTEVNVLFSADAFESQTVYRNPGDNFAACRLAQPDNLCIAFAAGGDEFGGANRGA